MRVKLTPLNILVAILITGMAYLLIFPDESGWHLLGSVSLLMLCVVSFISDIIFRFFIKDLKRIWIVEICFLIFAIVLIIIIKR